jgi:hypothetical protein
MNKKHMASVRMMELDGAPPEKIVEIKKIFEESEKEKILDSFKSWFTIVISTVALIVSILVAIFK